MFNQRYWLPTLVMLFSNSVFSNATGEFLTPKCPKAMPQPCLNTFPQLSPSLLQGRPAQLSYCSYHFGLLAGRKSKPQTLLPLTFLSLAQDCLDRPPNLCFLSFLYIYAYSVTPSLIQALFPTYAPFCLFDIACPPEQQ